MTIPPDELAEFASWRVSDDFEGVTITPPAEAPMDPEARDREFQLASRALGHDVTTGHDQLHHYWTVDPKGRGRWVDSATPWTTLEHLLEEHVPPEMAKRLAASFFHDVFHYWPGDDKNRVAHGKPPRGDKTGPG